MLEPREGDDFCATTAPARCSCSPPRTSRTSASRAPSCRPRGRRARRRSCACWSQNRWPFRIHATYDETITRILDVFERSNRDVPFDGLRWFFDHAETISDRNIERMRRSAAASPIQHRMAYQGEYFVERYGAEAAARTPPVRRMLDAGVPVGAGTDATRVASYNPWVALYWLVDRAARVGGLRCTATTTGSTASRRCACGRTAARGSPAKRTRRAGSRSGSSPTSPCCRPTTSASPTRRSRTSRAC